MFLVLLILSVLTIASARPNDFDAKNVFTVPPNCPPGQEWINGLCRDIWFKSATPAPELNIGEDFKGRNVITVPPNCPTGQEWINGQCRDIWFRIAVPASTLNEQDLDSGISAVNVADESDAELSLRSIISVPPQCPIGWRLDALGNCRKIFE